MSRINKAIKTGSRLGILRLGGGGWGQMELSVRGDGVSFWGAGNVL